MNIKRMLAAVLLALGLGTAVTAFDTTKTPVAPDGTKAIIDLPGSQHMTNTGGSDGAGLCVYTSVTVGARWQNLPDMFNLRKFAEGRPGGSYPEKLEADLATYAKRYGVTVPPHVQHTGGDEAFLRLCFATRRIPCMTYAGLDGFYDSGVAHMVNGAHLDDKHGAIIDNNRAGSWVWMTDKQLVQRWNGLDDNNRPILVPFGRARWGPVGGGWCFCWLGPPPPPKPAAAADVEMAPTPHGLGYVWERVLVGTPFNLATEVQWRLYKDGELLGAVIDGKWYVAVSDTELDTNPVDMPEGTPAPPENEPTADFNKGVVLDKVAKCNRYWVNGVEASRAKAVAAVADPGNDLLDDSDRYHLSIVGADKKVVASWFAPGGPLEKYARRVHVQVYAATDWPVKDRLSANVTLQEPAKVGGRVAGRGADTAVTAVGNLLGSVFDVPPPIKPDPPKPAPAPAPSPDPTPVPVPVPVPSTPWWKLILAVILGWFGVKFATRAPAQKG